MALGAMNPSNSWEALKPLAARMPPVVREHEILRVSATIYGKDRPKLAEDARREVLTWAQKRCGGRLPQAAWDFQEFEYLSGGRNSIVARIEIDGTDIWSIRTEDPDKSVAGRIWTTEVVVGFSKEKTCGFSARLLVSTSEKELAIEPHTPGFVQQIAEKCMLLRGPIELNPEPWLIETEGDADRLIEILFDQTRVLPIFVLTVPDSAVDQHAPLLDPYNLARATLGTALVAILPAALTWTLTNRVGKQRSVFGGAVRAYMPGFNEDASPYSHRLVLAQNVLSQKGSADCASWMKSLAATESVRRTRLGAEVLAFSTIRNTSLQLKQLQLEEEGASDTEQLDAANTRIAALETALASEKDWSSAVLDESIQVEERARAAEIQLNSATFRIQQLLDQLRTRGDMPNGDTELPSSWIDFEDWCDKTLVGRLSLASAARKGLHKAGFDDVSVAARAVNWLAGDYRDRRLEGGDGDMRDFVLEPGIRNSPCGSDEFKVSWQGQPHLVDWHIKNGGNTRDPRRCLRIYYFWDDITQQVVIAHMPAHRDTSAS